MLASYRRNNIVIVQKDSSRQNGDSKKKWDLESILKFIGVVLTIATIIIGIIQYRKAVEREFRSNFYNEQIKVYNELLQLGSNIAVYNVDSLDTQSFRSLENDFEKLYYGRLNLYQNEEVANKLSHFYVAMKRFKNDEDGVDNELMENLVFQVAQACRQSLADTYDINLNNLEFDYHLLNNFNDSTSE